MSNAALNPQRLSLALLHFPVFSRGGDVIVSAVFSQDIHDLARLSSTYGLGPLFLVTPIEAQQKLIQELAGHWKDGWGKEYNPSRSAALEGLRVVPFWEDAVKEMERSWGEAPWKIGSTAKEWPGSWSPSQVRGLLEKSSQPVLLGLGTAHGLTEEFLNGCDAVMEPINEGDFNHLSVRSAASILVDRILGKK